MYVKINVDLCHLVCQMAERVKYMKKISALLLAFAISISFINTAFAGYTVVTDADHNMLDTLYSSVGKASKNSKWALIDSNGNPITDYRWDALGTVSGELIPAQSGGIWGYISPNGTTVIPYQFANASDFSEGFAHVVLANNVHAYIDKSGEVVFNTPFDYSFDVSGGAICGISDGLYGYCDTEGHQIIAPQFDCAFDFCEGLAAVCKDGKWGYISTYGSYAISPSYLYAGDFYKGYAVCKTSSGYGLINKNGKRVTDFKFDYIGTPDSQGRYPVKQGNTSGYINVTGTWVIKTDYEFCYTFTDGYARVFADNLWGYIDENGTEVVAPTFADCGEYRNGVAPYSLDGITYGYMSLNSDIPEVSNPGSTVTEPDTQETTPTPSVTPVTPAGGTITHAEMLSSGELTPTIPESGILSMRIGSLYAAKAANAKELVATPALIDGVTMVPLRDTVEYLGGKIEWNEDTQRIAISYNNNRISVTIGSKLAFVNGVASTLNAAPVLADGITMIPLRSVAQALRCEVEWIGDTQSIYIHY